jgi:transposase-like protein
MSKTKIKKQPHSAEFKFRVALAAWRGDKTVSQLCQEFGVVSSQLYKWKTALLQSGANIFKNGTNLNSAENGKEIDKLHAAIGRLKVENDFLSQVLGHSR